MQYSIRKNMKKTFRKRCRQMDAFTWILFGVVALYVLSLIFVLGFGLLNSLKYWKDFQRGNIFGLPKSEYGWYFSNYITVFKDFMLEIRSAGTMPRNVYMPEMFFNTIVYSVVVSLFSIATQVMVAYAVAKYNFRFKKVIHTTAIIVIMIPVIGSLASEFQLAQALHLNNSVLGIAIMRCKYPGIYYLVFYAMFKNLPWSYAEAAQMDGAGHLTIFLRIMLPMVMGTVAAVFVLQFIANWNDYTTPMIFTPMKPTISYGLFMYQNNHSTGMSTPLKLAASFMSCVPIIILFVIFRNKIMGNITMGGLKG